MATQPVDFFECLGERVGMLVFDGVSMYSLPTGAVDADAGGAGRGEEVRGSCCEGVDVGGVGVGDCVGLEVLFGLYRS